MSCVARVAKAEEDVAVGELHRYPSDVNVHKCREEHHLPSICRSGQRGEEAVAGEDEVSCSGENHLKRGPHRCNQKPAHDTPADTQTLWCKERGPATRQQPTGAGKPAFRARSGT